MKIKSLSDDASWNEANDVLTEYPSNLTEKQWIIIRPSHDEIVVHTKSSIDEIESISKCLPLLASAVPFLDLPVFAHGDAISELRTMLKSRGWK